MVSSRQSVDSPANRPDAVIRRARRAAVRLALFGGTGVAVIGALQVVFGDDTGLETLVAASLTAGIAAFMFRMDDPPVERLLILTAVFAAAAELSAALAGDIDFIQGAGSEIVIVGLGILAVFMAPDRNWAIGGVFMVLAVVTVLISEFGVNASPLEALSDVTVTIAVLGTLTSVVVRVQRSLVLSNSRYFDLAGVIPVAMFELDMTRVVGRFDQLRGAGVSELRATLLEDNALLLRLVRLMRLSYANHQAVGLTGEGVHWRELFTGPNYGEMCEGARNILTGLWDVEDGGRGRMDFVGADGTTRVMLYQWVVGRTAGERDPKRVVVAATDVTRLRSAEQALADQLRQRDQFVATVSHELRTPLTAVMGFTNELVERPEDFSEAERADILATILEEVDDVSSIVEDLLVTARAETGNLTVALEPVDLSAAVERIVDPGSSLFVSGTPVAALADPARLRQIIRNLVTNAHRYGGTRRRITIGADDDVAYLEVRDDGPAIDDSDRQRIFQPYERSAESAPVGSVGLGLHVARVLARLMGGDLTYDHDGAESVFRLVLPPVVPSAQPAASR